MDQLNQKLTLLEDAFGVTILIARITGRRWSFSKRTSIDKIPVSSSSRIVLNPNCGAVVYGWNNLDAGRQKELEKKLLDLGVNSL